MTIDTLAIAQLLRKRGFSEERAIGVVEALKEIDAWRLMTKSDLIEAIAHLKAGHAALARRNSNSAWRLYFCNNEMHKVRRSR